MDSDHSAVEAKTTAKLLIPQAGEDLCQRIAAEARAGRPTWRIRSMWVPRLPFRAGPTAGLVAATFPIGIPANGKIRNPVAASLAKRAPWPHDWTPHERAQQRCLYVAALRDLRGETDPHDLRVATSIDRDARVGRELWAGIGAWPWSLYGDHGGSAIELRDWRQNEHVILAWRQWLA